MCVRDCVSVCVHVCMWVTIISIMLLTSPPLPPVALLNNPGCVSAMQVTTRRPGAHMHIHPSRQNDDTPLFLAAHSLGLRVNSQSPKVAMFRLKNNAKC